MKLIYPFMCLGIFLIQQYGLCAQKISIKKYQNHIYLPVKLQLYPQDQSSCNVVDTQKSIRHHFTAYENKIHHQHSPKSRALYKGKVSFEIPLANSWDTECLSEGSRYKKMQEIHENRKFDAQDWFNNPIRVQLKIKY